MIVLSYGGGTNSKAILCGMKEKALTPTKLFPENSIELECGCYDGEE